MEEWITVYVFVVYILYFLIKCLRTSGSLERCEVIYQAANYQRTLWLLMLSGKDHACPAHCISNISPCWVHEFLNDVNICMWKDIKVHSTLHCQGMIFWDITVCCDSMTEYYIFSKWPSEGHLQRFLPDSYCHRMIRWYETQSCFTRYVDMLMFNFPGEHYPSYSVSVLRLPFYFKHLLTTWFCCMLEVTKIVQTVRDSSCVWQFLPSTSL